MHGYHENHDNNENHEKIENIVVHSSSTPKIPIHVVWLRRDEMVMQRTGLQNQLRISKNIAASRNYIICTSLCLLMLFCDTSTSRYSRPDGTVGHPVFNEEPETS
uniref:Uncharacterized protein n=1 Tax=Romanomermis culicivorax TaxID=13658 RepID=A0A915KMF8_ROMCU